jgi:hypothetical protein
MAWLAFYGLGALYLALAEGGLSAYLIRFEVFGCPLLRSDGLWRYVLA